MEEGISIRLCVCVCALRTNDPTVGRSSVMIDLAVATRYGFNNSRLEISKPFSRKEEITIAQANYG